MSEPCMNSSREQANWDEIWRGASMPIWDEMCEELLNVLLSEIHDIRGKSVLECGCGSGRISVKLACLGASVTLLDKSEAALELASHFAQQKGAAMDLVQGDIFSMPFPDAQFDLVWNAGVLEHVDEAQQVEILREMKRVCKPDGLVVTVVPNAANPLYRLVKWWSEKTGRWVFGEERPATSLEEIFGSAGLRVVREYTSDFGDSVRMLEGLPGSEALRSLFHIWYESLDGRERAQLPGRWLVTVGRVEVSPREGIVNPSLSEFSSRSPSNPSKTYMVPDSDRVGGATPHHGASTADPRRGVEEANPPTWFCHVRETSKDLPPVVCLSSIRWDELYQRPQQIMSRLAQYGHKVLFVEPTFRDLKLDSAQVPPQTFKYALDNYVSQSLRRKARGLYTFNSVRYVEWGNPGALVRRDAILASIRAACDLLDMRDPVWWVVTPLWHKTIEELPISLPVVYDCVDDHRYFAGVNPNAMGRLDDLLAKRANLVLATAKRLFGEKTGIANVLYLPNGADFEAFQSVSPVEPGDLWDIPRPRLGFSGAVSTWVDVDLLYELASSWPDWHIVVVGSIYVDVSRLLALPNFHYLGKKDPGSLPAYVKGFDVGIIPFKPDHPLVASANPIKLYEYLACGTPVVSTRWDEIAEFEDVVSFAAGAQEFGCAVEELLKNRPAAEKLKARARAFRWETIARIASRALSLARADASGNGCLMEQVLTEIERLKEEAPGGPAPYPEGSDVIRAYAKVLHGDLQGALRLLREGHGNTAPDRICELVSRLHVKGLNSEAIGVLEHALEEYPENCDLMYNLAVLLAERNRDPDRGRAAEILCHIIQRQPEDAEARSLLDAIAGK